MGSFRDIISVECKVRNISVVVVVVVSELVVVNDKINECCAA